MKYGYARVSTIRQAREGMSLEAQRKALMAEGATIIYEDHYSGMTTDRPELNKLISVVEEGDTILVTKLDRFARSVVHGLELVNVLFEKGVRLHILNMGIVDRTPGGKLMRTIFFAFAEFERDMFYERTQEGKAAKRASDPSYREGRKVREIPDLSHYVELVERGELSVAEACRTLGISTQTWYRRLKE